MSRFLGTHTTRHSRTTQRYGHCMAASKQRCVCTGYGLFKSWRQTRCEIHYHFSFDLFLTCCCSAPKPVLNKGPRLSRSLRPFQKSYFEIKLKHLFKAYNRLHNTYIHLPHIQIWSLHEPKKIFLANLPLCARVSWRHQRNCGFTIFIIWCSHIVILHRMSYFL